MTKGFDIFIDGVQRSFHDQRPAAYKMAMYLKEKNPGCVVEFLDNQTGEKTMILPDGRGG